MRCTLQLKPVSFVGSGAGSGAAECGRVYSAGPVCYAEVPPPRDLALDVVCFWNLGVDADASTYVQHLLPDLTTDVISRDGGRAFVMGPLTGALQIHLKPGTRLAGARLRPGAARRLLDCSSVDLLNGVIPLDALVPTRLPGSAPGWEQHFHAAVTQMLRSRVAADHTCTRPDSTVRSAVEWLTANWRSSVDELSRHVGWSNRELHRRFVASVGVGPKMVQRIVRVQHGLRIVHASEGKVALSDLALECGFADQAHLTREVVHFTDLTPHRVRALAQPSEPAVRAIPELPIRSRPRGLHEHTLPQPDRNAA